MDPTVPAARASERRRLLAVAAVIWLGCGLAQSVQSLLFARATGRAWSFGPALVSGMPWWISWMLFTPLIAWIARRFTFAPGARWRSVAAHVVAGTAIASVHLALTGSAYWFTTARVAGPATSLGNQVQRFFGNYFLEALVTYAAVAGAFVAIDFARGMRDEALARARAEAEAAALEATVANARFELLAMELKPHFLFNTLSAISGLIAQNRAPEAREMIQRLSSLLRQTLAGEGKLAPVSREMELMDDYLYIQRARFSDRLSVAINVDDHAQAALVPAMLLQPLVENAIRYGIEPMPSRGEVGINIARHGTHVRISVTDTGPGFRFDARGALPNEGIGIGNTRARLAHLYGKGASIELRNRESGGAVVLVDIPAMGDLTTMGDGRGEMGDVTAMGDGKWAQMEAPPFPILPLP
ncbi:MAG TPA: histidine kinase [Gemmatimonadaceae bacterium]|nr:histidine kinase [Gemmatimonadaceae bacterium]